MRHWSRGLVLAASLAFAAPIFFAPATILKVNPHSNVVHGYTRHDGKHVNSYHRTVGNKTQKDNYSSKPNTNPWNGKKGTKQPKH